METHGMRLMRQAMYQWVRGWPRSTFPGRERGACVSWAPPAPFSAPGGRARTPPPHIGVKIDVDTECGGAGTPTTSALGHLAWPLAAFWVVAGRGIPARVLGAVSAGNFWGAAIVGSPATSHAP